MSARVAHSRLRLWLGLGVAGAAAAAVYGWQLLNVGADAAPAHTYEGTGMNAPAADFRLTNQYGTSVALSDFRGRVVVLAFLDPNCTDVCPLTALHLRQAQETLGETGARPVLLAVNANPHAASIHHVAEASARWNMAAIADWHFLTGDDENLQEVWTAYDVLAGGPKHGKPGEVQHTPGVYVIDSEGTKRWYVSTAFEGAPALSELLVKHIQALRS